MHGFSPTTPKISILMVTHNVGKTLHRSLVSLENQRLTNFEVLVVEVSSKDNTLKQLRAISERDLRFDILCLDKISDPEGLSAILARTRGDYIYVMDPTSWMDPSYLYDLVSCAERDDLDMVMSGYTLEVTTWGGKQHFYTPGAQTVAFTSQKDFRISSRLLMGSGQLLPLAGKLISKSYLMRNKIDFKNKNLWQHAFVMDCIDQIERVGVLHHMGCHVYRTLHMPKDAKEAKGMFLDIESEHRAILEMYGRWELRKNAEFMALIHSRYIEQLAAFFEAMCASPSIGADEIQELVLFALQSEMTKISAPRARPQGNGAKSMLPLMRTENAALLLVQARLIALMRRGTLPTMSPDAFI